MGHALKFKDFKRVFGRSLDDFWGRPGKDFDGVVRQHPNNAQGFDLETFVRTYKLRVSLQQPLKGLRTRVLGLVGAKWGEEGVAVISRLLQPLRRVKPKIKKQAGMDSK